MQALSVVELREKLMSASRTSALMAMDAAPMALDALAQAAQPLRLGRLADPLSLSRAIDDCTYQVLVAADLGLLHAHIGEGEYSALSGQMRSLEASFREGISSWLAEQAGNSEARTDDRASAELFAGLDQAQAELRQKFLQMRVAAQGEANAADAQMPQ